MKISTTSPSDQVRSLHYKYEIPEETAQRLISEGYRFLELDKAALLSCLSEQPIETILAMRKEDPWGIIEKELGLTPMCTTRNTSPIEPTGSIGSTA